MKRLATIVFFSSLATVSFAQEDHGADVSDNGGFTSSPNVQILSVDVLPKDRLIRDGGTISLIINAKSNCEITTAGYGRISPDPLENGTGDNGPRKFKKLSDGSYQTRIDIPVSKYAPSGTYGAYLVNVSDKCNQDAVLKQQLEVKVDNPRQDLTKPEITNVGIDSVKTLRNGDHEVTISVSARSNSPMTYAGGSMTALANGESVAGWNMQEKWRRTGRGTFETKIVKTISSSSPKGDYEVKIWNVENEGHQLSDNGVTAPVKFTIN